MNSSWFCDWVTVSQQHGPDVPDFVGGRVLKVTGLNVARRSEEGVAILGDAIDVDYCTGTFETVRGSWDTSLRVRCVGGRVEVSGNPSHWDRLDNLFGLSVDDCMAVINQLLQRLGLPVFTPFESLGCSQGRGSLTWHKRGAEFSRLDVTTNVLAGMGRVRDFNKWAASQKLYRSAPDDPGRYRFNTVYLSESVEYMGVKLYDKALAIEERTGSEFVKRLARAVKAGRITAEEARALQEEGAGYLERLAEWLASHGVCRYEVRFGRKKLEEGDCRGWLPGVTGERVVGMASENFERLLSRAVVVNGDAEELLTPAELSVYRAWRRGRVGVECAKSASTFYRVRSSILAKTGHDVNRPCGLVADGDVRPSYFRVRSLVPSALPSWYQQPVRLAA